MIQQGIAAAKAGDKDQAREILQDILRQDPKNETAWWWLASVLDKEDAIICLKNVLKLNPSNTKAQTALARLKSGGVASTTPKKAEPRQRAPQQDRPEEQVTEYSLSKRHRQEEILAWLEYAEHLYQKGQTRQQIAASLKTRGVNQEYITIVLKKFVEQRKRGGLKKMFQGGTGCLGALVVTVVLFLFFYVLTGNMVVVRTTLFITGGAMFLGIVLFLGGLIQYISAWWLD
jgi:tetratricopeptide (TPR) repeat protein